MSKKIILILIPVVVLILAIFGGYFYIVNWPLGKAGIYGQLKPEVTTTLNNRKFTKPEASVAAVSIKDQILGAKVVLPITIVTTDKGDNLLVLINKKIRLPSSYAPADLVDISGFTGAKLLVETADKLLQMLAAAKSEGLDLTIVSAYRSYQDQVSVFNGWVASAGLKNAESFSAKPGFSQHQLGTAVDIGAVGKSTFSDSFGKTPEGMWLEGNSYKYGFVISYPAGKETVTGYSYEPWHFRYIGVNNAQTMVNAGLILEEYLQKFGTW